MTAGSVPGRAPVRVRAVRPDDADAWLRARLALWPDGSEAEHRQDISRLLAGTAPEPAAVLLAEDESGRLLGFVELSIRPYVEGCRTNRIAYIEGWYVAPDARRRGVGRALVAAAESWGRAQGCAELGSDTEAENVVSASAHRALGFADVGLVRCFRKDL